MKKIENKTTEIPAEGEAIKYSEIIKTILDFTPAEGFTFAEIKKRDRIEKSTVKENEFLEYEDADFDHLKKLLETTKLRIRHPDLVKFYDDMKA